jgi:hypothetical protein
MIKSITSIRSKNDVTGKTIFYRVRTDSAGFTGNIVVMIGAKHLMPDQSATITGEDSIPFSIKHTQSGKQVVTVSGDAVSNSVQLDLDKPADP